MKPGRRLAVAGALALAASVAMGSYVASMAAAVTVGDFPALPPDVRSRIRSEEIEDARHWSSRIALVLIPIAVGVVWWRSKRRG